MDAGRMGAGRHRAAPPPRGGRGGRGEGIDVSDLSAYPERLDVAEHYAASRRRGIEQSGAFQGVAALHRGDGAVLAELTVHEGVAAGLQRYLLHPALLDSALQPLMTLLDTAGAEQDTYLRAHRGVPVPRPAGGRPPPVLPRRAHLAGRRAGPGRG
ncbi:polyketide synthase dehydratase domain-containing protein [Planomonospora algeriensis]